MQQYSFLKIGFPERSNVVNWLSLHHNVSNTELCDTSNVVSKFSPHDSQFNDRLWDTSNEESEFLSHEIHVRALQRLSEDDSQGAGRVSICRRGGVMEDLL